MKLADIQNAARKENPNFTVEFEVIEEDGSKTDHEVTFHNILRTKESERDAIAKEFSAIAVEKVSAAEKKAKSSNVRLLTRRMERALGAVTGDKEAYNLLLTVLDEDGADYDAYISTLFASYYKETQLGEVSASVSS